MDSIGTVEKTTNRREVSEALKASMKKARKKAKELEKLKGPVCNKNSKKTSKAATDKQTPKKSVNKPRVEKIVHQPFRVPPKSTTHTDFIHSGKPQRIKYNAMTMV